MMAHVILCNDAVKKVVLEDEEFACQEMETLAKRDFELNHKDKSWLISSKYEEYRNINFWHIRTAPVAERS